MYDSAAILLGEKRAYWSMRSDVFAEIRREYGLRGEGDDPYLPPSAIEVRATPPDGDFSRPASEWKLHFVDHELLPDWWDAEENERRARRALNRWIATRVVQAGETRRVENGVFHAVGDPYVFAGEDTIIIAHDRSRILAGSNAIVMARDNSRVNAHHKTWVTAYDESTVWACHESTVYARDRSRVSVTDMATALAYDNSTVGAFKDSIVRAYDNSTVAAHGNSTVIAYDRRVSVDMYNSVGAVAIFRERSDDPRVAITSGRIDRLAS